MRYGPAIQPHNETVTEGLDGLRDRLREYRGMGARFAKWRAVIHLTDVLPSSSRMNANAYALARYASLCQEHEFGSIRTRWRRHHPSGNDPRTAATGATTDARDQSCVSALCAARWHRIRGGNDGKRAVRQGAGIDGCVLAGRKLPVGRPDLSLRQPAAQATTHKGSH